MFQDYSGLVTELLRSGQLKSLSYRYQVKPAALKGVPKYKCAVLIKDLTSEPATYRYESDLDAIPLRYLTLTSRDNEILLRQECSTTLQEIKNFHARKLQALNFPESALKEHCAKLDLGMDGVQECNKGRRTLWVVAARLGGASGPIYPWKILNPLIGNPDAKPGADDILR